MIILNSRGIFHTLKYAYGKPIAFPTKITNIVPHLFDTVVVESETTFKHIMNYLVIPHISFIESVYKVFLSDAHLQLFIDEMKTKTEEYAPFQSLVLTWNYAHSFDEQIADCRCAIFPTLKGKQEIKRKVAFSTISFTPLNQLVNLHVSLDERLEISNPEEIKVYVCHRAFSVHDLIVGILTEICEFKSPENRRANQKSFVTTDKPIVRDGPDDTLGTPVLV